MYPTTPNPNPTRRGLTLIEIILGLTVGALLVFSAFVSFQHIFTKTREHAELAALKSVAREAQALLAISGADAWDTQAGLDAVMEALEDWPPAQAATMFGVVADDSSATVIEGDVWPEVAELTFSRSPQTLVMVVPLDTGACVATATPHGGTIQGGCITDLGEVGESTPAEAVTNQQIPGINNTDAQPATTTTTTVPEPDPGFWAQTSAGQGHTCALTAAGDAYCWGYGAFGQLGIGSTTQQNTPVKVSGSHSFKEITGGGNHTCGLTTVGVTYCWGRNTYGGLGIRNTTQQTTPAKVSGNHSFVEITAGYRHSCGVTVDGDAWCWGPNDHGQLGIGNTIEQTTPAKVYGNHSFVSISTGNIHTCGVTVDGDAWCWGTNDAGQLGIGYIGSYSISPMKVSGDHSFVSISTSDSHTCAITTTGEAYCWGSGGNGRLGNGNTTNQYTPVKVSGDHSFVSISAGSGHTCVITTTGDAYCWGYNAQGQLGIGNTTTQTTPVKVSGNHSFVTVAAGQSHTCGVTTTGDAYCWGYNAQGQLGIGNTTTQTTPVKVVEP